MSYQHVWFFFFRLFHPKRQLVLSYPLFRVPPCSYWGDFFPSNLSSSCDSHKLYHVFHHSAYTFLNLSLGMTAILILYLQLSYIVIYSPEASLV